MSKRQGVGGWGIRVLATFSFTVCHQVQEDFNFPSHHSYRGPSVWGNPQTTIKPFISGPLSHRTPSCSNQVYEAFPLFYVSWIGCKICQPLPVPLVLSWEVPLPSVGSTRLLWFLTGVTWKCTGGAFWLFHSQIQGSLGHWQPSTRKLPRQAQVKAGLWRLVLTPNPMCQWLSLGKKRKREKGYKVSNSVT